MTAATYRATPSRSARCCASAGYEAYIVGGAVRDLIMGIEPKDFDVATNATPEEIRPLFRRARIIGRRFQLVHVVFGQEIIETSTFRAHRPRKHTRRPTSTAASCATTCSAAQEEDAARRDFTAERAVLRPADRKRSSTTTTASRT